MRATGRATALALLVLGSVPSALGARTPAYRSDPERLVREARAASRAGRPAEARRRYLAAAAGAPEIGDWLLRRAALLTSDSAGRATLYAQVTSALVRARLPETEAIARERYGDFVGAASRYESLGRVVDATRVRLKSATTSGQRWKLQQDLVTVLERSSGGPEVGPAISLLFTYPVTLSPAQSLIVARAATRARLAARAVALYPRGIAAGLAMPEDRLSYGLALAQVGRPREALIALARVPVDAPSAAEAAYRQGAIFSKLGQKDSALARLALVTGVAGDTAVVPRALLLVGEIRDQAHDAEGARLVWLDLARRYPRHEVAGRARFLAALILWEQGDTRNAAREWKEQFEGSADADALAAGYWAGRALEQSGDPSLARQLWQSVIERDPRSYYAGVSAARLGVGPWSPAPADDRFEAFAGIDSARMRLQALRGLGMEEEAGWERDALLAPDIHPAEWWLAAADALRASGLPSAAVVMGRRAIRAGAPEDARTYRLIYPLLFPEAVRQEAARNGVDHLLVAALIRQESSWESSARSRVGARGLMQVMPATGRDIARDLGLARWDPATLYEPAMNIRFGTHYLAGVLRRSDGDLARTLAAYNAGPARVSGWLAGATTTDPEAFVERISLSETRDYVRVVQRNLALYHGLYGG